MRPGQLPLTSRCTAEAMAMVSPYGTPTLVAPHPEQKLSHSLPKQRSPVHCCGSTKGGTFDFLLGRTVMSRSLWAPCTSPSDHKSAVWLWEYGGGSLPSFRPSPLKHAEPE